MFITATIIHDVSDLNVIINTPLNVPLIPIGDKASNNEEITKNMWVLSLDQQAAKTISVGELIKFVDVLLEKRRKQLSQKHITCPVIFYMWFDEMAAQLRFNIISDFNKKLPFGCQLEVVHSPESILEDFLTSQYHDGIPWGELEELDDDSDEDEQSFILKVYVAHLN